MSIKSIKETNVDSLTELINNSFDEIQKNLTNDLKDILSDEIEQLIVCNKFTHSIEQRLLQLYQHVFPKQCRNCGKIYPNKEVFITETSNLKNNGVICDKRGLQEYRNCGCGSTLMVWTKDERRDDTPFGIARRKLFELCVNKLTTLSTDSEEIIRKNMRSLFKSVIKNTEKVTPSLNI